MPRRTPLAVLLLLASSAAAPLAAQQSARSWDEARFAWEDGDYPESLRGQLSILESPDSSAYLERIALLTGELYEVRELARDGRNVRWSPDGQWIAYETVAGGIVSTHLVRSTAARQAPVARITRTPFAGTPEQGPERPNVQPALTLAGGGLSFDPDDQRVAYLPPEGAVHVDRLDGGPASVLPATGLHLLEVVVATDAVHVLAAKHADATEKHVYSLRPGAERTRLTSEPADRTGLRRLPDGRLLVGIREIRPHLPGRPSPTRFEVIDPANGRVTSHTGSAVSVSEDGSRLAYLQGGGDRWTIHTLDLATGASRGLLETDEPLAAPALSSDGETIVLQAMPLHDWELYTLGAAAAGGFERVTQEIQHDLFPRFLDPTTVLAVKGESRHRRSYLHDLTTGEGRRLFHNNTVRTIAPEYEWSVSPDGRRVLIVSERDGDTVSPERGVYLVDLDSRVTVGDVAHRLRSMLAEEESLRATAERIFAPVADAVRARTQEVSIARLYAYQETMYRFGSKYITQPGNQAASAYLFEMLRSFGYEPEYQWFDARDRRTGETVRTANVIATLPGAVDPELVYVVSSHYDSVEPGPGADDNTSGTSVLLETARLLAEHPLPTTVHLAFFTGEEAGLLGSREYVRRAVEDGVRIVGALNNDMIGWSGDHRLDNTIRYSNAGIRDLQHAAALGFSDLITYDALYYKNTDAHAYYEVYGDIVGGIGSYPVLANPHYHRPTDRIETINQELVRETARTNVASLMLLASSPSRIVGLSAMPAAGGLEARWTPSPESDVVSYEIAYGPADDPMRHRQEVTAPRALLQGAMPDWHVAVRAVNARGLSGWDWARRHGT